MHSTSDGRAAHSHGTMRRSLQLQVHRGANYPSRSLARFGTARNAGSGTLNLDPPTWIGAAG